MMTFSPRNRSLKQFINDQDNFLSNSKQKMEERRAQKDMYTNKDLTGKP